MASIQEEDEETIVPSQREPVESMELVPSDMSPVGTQRYEAASAATRAVVPAAQAGTPVIYMDNSNRNITNLDNRQINVNQQVTPPSGGTQVTGQGNIAFNVGSGANVNFYQNEPQGEPQGGQHTCHQPKLPKVEEPDSSDDEDEDVPQGEGAIPHVDYNNLMWDVFIEPMEENERLFRKFRFLCRQVWATQHGLSSKTNKMKPERLLKHMEKCQLLSPHNLEFLLEMMKKLKQDESVRQIKDYLERHKGDILTRYKPNGTVANGKFHTEIVKPGSITRAQVSDMDRIKRVFNEQLGLPKSAVNFTGSGSGSVVFVFLLPVRWSWVDKDGNRRVINVLKKLEEAVQSKADWLLKEGIIGVHIQGQHYVRLDDLTHQELDVPVHDEVSLLDISDSEDDNGHPNETSDVALESSNTQEEAVDKYTELSGHDGEALKYVKQQRAKPKPIPAAVQGATAIHKDEGRAEYLASEKEKTEILNKFQNIGRRINLVLSNQVRYIPSMMKTYLRDLQREIQKTADTVAKMGLLDPAISMYSRGLDVGEYARSIGFEFNVAINRNIMLGRVECALKVAKASHDNEIKQFFLQRSLDDSQLVYKMDSDDPRSLIYMIAAMSGLAQFLNDPMAIFHHSLRTVSLIHTLPEEHHSHEMIREFIETIKHDAELLNRYLENPEYEQQQAEETTEKAEKQGKTETKRKKRTTKLRSQVGHSSEKHREKRKHSRQPKGTESGMGSELLSQTSSDSDTDDLGCSYCNPDYKIRFETVEEKNHHILTPEHKTNLNSDQDRPWKYRSPPLNVINGNYHLCERFSKGNCPFSRVPSANDSCPLAHSNEELKEWKERHKYRRMKMLKASKKNMFSFLDELQTEYYLAEKPLEVMTERIPDGVTIAFQPPDLKVYVKSTDTDDNVVYKNEWKIVINISDTSKKPLVKIGLLNDIYRLHFCLTHPSDTKRPQICQAREIPSSETEDGQKQHTIGVLFSSRMLGKYEQWIVFDFGDKPIVFHKLGVHVGSTLDVNDDNLRNDNAEQTWDPSNCNIVKFNRFQSGYEKRLEIRYRKMALPQEAGILNSENYKHFMHYMLQTEESERTEKLKSYGMTVRMTPKQMFHVKSSTETVTFVAEKGQRYGKIDLTHALNDDTSASQIVLTSVQYLYIKFEESSDTVYEAEIFHDREVEEAQTKDELFVILSDRCVRDMALASSQTKRVQIQFQLDRRPLLRMHDAVDKITTMEYLFPPENPNPALICPQEPIEGLSSTCSSREPPLNKWQDAAARFITSRGGSRDQTPLLLLYGPFGTGKTFTLAKGVMDTLLKAGRPSHATDCPRILICTHSNSAADLYITRYLHKFVQTCMASKKYRVQIRRVYATTRDIRSIPKAVRPYTNIERGRLRIDTEDIRQCHVVVTTTSTAARLHNLPKGHFTHILLDEAGQILETEAIIPLAFAKQHTCVVIAGDHVQMGPVVYSAEAKAGNFDHSLLERLFEYSSSNNCHRHIILSDNYRSCKEILKFLSTMFYHAKHLQALGDHHTIAGLYPMEFRAVMGDDECICLGNSYVNNFEADEIAKRLKKLQNDWPDDWGKFNQSDIGVLTPYTMQVRRIRKLLDKIGFSDVIVERVQNVQGKEYRIVFISTVRTRKTITDNISDDPDHYLGFLSDTRQLNTALTRAKSLVVVVGNPVALCSVGKCCKVWQRYIEECYDNKSLYGVGDVLEIEYAIQSVTSSSGQADFKGERFEDSGFESYQYSTAEDEHSTIEDTHTGYKQRFSVMKSKEMWKAKSHELEPSASSESTTEDEEIDLLQELKRESRRRRKRHDTLTTPDASESESEADPADFYMVDEDDGEVWVQRRVLRHVEGDEGSKTPTGEVKKCKFRVDYDGKKYAVPIDDPVGSEEILISTNTQRKTALDGDEVEVEVIEDPTLVDTDVEQHDDTEVHHIYGRVIRVNSRAEEMRDKEIVCFPDLYADNLMVPVDRTMPKIFILRPKEDRQKKRGQEMLTIPICRFREKRAQCIRNVTVASKDRANTLFVVRWLSWEDRFYYPLGMVIEELPKNVNEGTGLDTLRRIFYVPEEWDDEDVDKQRLINLSQNHPNTEDCTTEHVITIDPENSRDFDDALSVERLPDGFEVHIHIADVTHFVPKDGDIDKEARERVTSFYPSNNNPVYMLPSILSTELCSFVPGKNRLAVSVFAKIDINGNLIEEPRPKICQTVIRNRRRLTYCEAERMIEQKDGVKVGDYTRKAVILLHHVATIIRGQRLKGRRYALCLEGDTARTPQAHILVEEMMILANRVVGNFLVKKYRNIIPIRRQLQPETKKLKYWRDVHGRGIASSVYLSEEEAYLRSLGDGDFADIAPIHDTDTVDIQKTVWSKIQSLNLDDPNDKRTIAAIITSDQNHPQTVPALSALQHAMRKADYVCSGEFNNDDKLAHTSLQMKFYTHFTSPIRRYIDIVVHRMLKAALANEHPAYEMQEVSDICHQCSVKSRKAKDFESKTHALQLALHVRRSPVSVLSVVESVSDSNMMVGFSSYPMISEANQRSDIMFNLLKPIGKPDVDDEKKKARINWKERIFNVRLTKHMSQDDVRGNRQKHIELDTKRFVVTMPASRWLQMQESVNRGDKVSLRELIQAESTKQQSISVPQESSKAAGSATRVTVTEVSCELGQDRSAQKSHHYVEFKREFSPGDVLQVQLQTGLQRGLMSPKVALVNVTPLLNFCAEHRSEAVECFAEIVDRHPSREDIKKYQRTWLPIVEMMTVYNAVYGNDTTIIHGVQIEWQQRSSDSLPCGSFNLSTKFCNDRHIKIFSPRGTGLKFDYLCIRCSDPKEAVSFTSDNQAMQQYDSDSICEYQQSTFVAHGYVVDTNADDDDDGGKGNKRKPPEYLTVFFQVHHCSSPFPIRLLTSSGEDAHRCTVEVIPKAIPDRRIEKAVQQLDKAPEIVHDICLMKPINRTDNEKAATMNLDDLEIKASPFPPLNFSQKKALHRARTQPFTVIQGPPGTGKTMTGACLVHFFTEDNKKLRGTGKRPQVLYCGPSNKSVDVIAGYLKRFKDHNKLSVIRVYSESIEYKDFPPPFEPGPRRKLESEDVKMDPDLHDISLHCRIRRKPNSYAEVIRSFERQFGQNSKKVPSEDDIVEYFKNIQRAEREELDKHQVILCTCNTAGQKRIRKFTNIIQCIVDEAGMCNEPETAIPLVSTKPKKIVLIGDHKQLRPIIQENTAQQLGMEISLLEQYSKKVEMLDIQYRMHKAICEFPSNNFYNGRLKTGERVTQQRQYSPLQFKWPGGPQQPTVFCNIIGKEETLSVHTEEGNEMSKANRQEIVQVVRIACTLVKHYGVQAKNVVILTQYQLQRKNIELSLKDKRVNNIDVRTVIKSQGSEWDFVIISTVRSLPRVEIEENSTYGWRKHNLGFITDDNQMNVALTRAKKGLIIVGNMYLLQTDKRWKKLIEYYWEKDCVILQANAFLPKTRRRDFTGRYYHANSR